MAGQGRDTSRKAPLLSLLFFRRRGAAINLMRMPQALSLGPDYCTAPPSAEVRPVIGLHDACAFLLAKAPARPAALLS